MKQQYFAMLVLVILTTTSCADIVGIDQEYYLRGGCTKEPLVVAAGQQGANYVAVDATNVYWTNRYDGRVMKRAIDGGSAIEIASGQNEPRCIAVYENHVYWTNIGDGTVMRVNIDGTNRTTLATGQNKPYDIVVTDEFIFWTNEGTPPPEPPATPLKDGSIMRLRLPTPTSFPDPSTFVPGLNYPQAIAVSEDDVFWTDADYVMRTDSEGITRIQIAPLPYSPILPYQLSDIAVTSAGVFWTDTDNNKVNKVGITGSTPIQLAANDQTPFGIAVDADYVYWTTSVSNPTTMLGTINRVGINGGEAENLAEDQPYPVGIAVDQTCIYWANRNDGTVMKVAK